MNGLEEAIKQYSNARETQSVARFGFIREDGSHSVSSEDCHNKFSQIANSDTITGIINLANGWYKNPVVQHWLEYIFSQDSYYKSFINHLGDDLIILRDSKDRIRGTIVKYPRKYNSKLLMNFSKSMRSTNEHRDKLDFFEEWHMKRGYDATLSWILGFWFSTSFQKLNLGHAPIENSRLSDGFDLKRALTKGKGNWKWDEHIGASYSGENSYAFGGKFNPFNDIQVKGFKKLETRFWSKYNDGTIKNVNEEVMINFFNEVKTKLYKDFL